MLVFGGISFVSFSLSPILQCHNSGSKKIRRSSKKNVIYEGVMPFENIWYFDGSNVLQKYMDAAQCTNGVQCILVRRGPWSSAYPCPLDLLKVIFDQQRGASGGHVTWWSSAWPPRLPPLDWSQGQACAQVLADSSQDGCALWCLAADQGWLKCRVSSQRNLCHFLRLIARILTFHDKKYHILNFRDKTESYLTVLQQNNAEAC